MSKKSKKRGRRSSSSTSTKPTSTKPTSTKPASAKPETTKQRIAAQQNIIQHKKQARKFWVTRLGVFIVICAAIGGGLGWYFDVLQSNPTDTALTDTVANSVDGTSDSGQRSGFKSTNEAAQSSSYNRADADRIIATHFLAGPANRCFGGPRFQKKLGFQSGQSFIGTSPGRTVGLFLADINGGRVHQEPTWDDGGNLGSFVYDGQGHIYLIPTIFMHLHYDKLADQNKLYRVDSDTGEMSVMIDLPAAALPHAANPHGLQGVFYDCDTDSIYATSVSGSTYDQVVGRIYQVDVKTKAVVSSYDNIDAIGVGVYNGAEGKRLYFGAARDTGVYSLGLNKDGHIIGETRLEFYLAALPKGRNDNATRITFNTDGEMVLKGLDFHFTLTVENPLIYRNYTMRYDKENDSWKPVGVESKMK